MNNLYDNVNALKILKRLYHTNRLMKDRLKAIAPKIFSTLVLARITFYISSLRSVGPRCNRYLIEQKPFRIWVQRSGIQFL